MRRTALYSSTPRPDPTKAARDAVKQYADESAAVLPEDSTSPAMRPPWIRRKPTQISSEPPPMEGPRPSGVESGATSVAFRKATQEYEDAQRKALLAQNPLHLSTTRGSTSL